MRIRGTLEPREGHIDPDRLSTVVGHLGDLGGVLLAPRLSGERVARQRLLHQDADFRVVERVTLVFRSDVLRVIVLYLFAISVTRFYLPGVIFR